MSKKTILVVDDTDWNRELLVQLLEDEFTILQAVLGMPVMDGWEATRKIKADDAVKDIPIIAVTSHAMVGDEIDARKAGCDDYLPKPIDDELLLEKIHKCIG